MLQKNKSAKRLTTRYRIFNVCLLSTIVCLMHTSCSSVPRPNSFIWGVNGPAMWLEGYNILKDYDADGNLKPDAVKQFHPFLDVKDLNAAILILPPGKHEGDEGTKGVKRWIKESRDWIKAHCQ